MKTLASLLLAAAVAVAGLAGCKTESFCFANCDGSQAGGGGGGGVDGGGMGGGFAGVDGCVGFNCGRDDAGGDGNDCIQTNAGVEICDDIDNDCDGEIDEAADIDFTLPENCGNCDLDCTQELTRVVTELCNTDNIELGRDPGQCRYDECRPNFFDANNMATDGCEYYCPWNRTAPSWSTWAVPTAAARMTTATSKSTKTSTSVTTSTTAASAGGSACSLTPRRTA